MKNIVKLAIIAMLLSACAEADSPTPLPDDQGEVNMEADTIECVECPYGWTCDIATVGWRCWGGEKQPCEPLAVEADQCEPVGQ